MNHYNGYRRNPLDISELADFDESISHYSQSEQRRKRLIYLRDAAQQLKTGKVSILKGFSWFMIPLAIIPIFWPFFIFAWYMRKKASSMMNIQLENALEYWGIHEVEIDAYVTDYDSMDSDDLIPGL